MANCSYTSSRFTITKGVDNSFVFTIKQTGSTLPMELTLTDTFEVSLVQLGTNTEALVKSATLDANLLSGKISITITELEASTLATEVGSKVDRYYIKPTYKIIIDCKTTNNGNFIAKIAEVYVD